MCCELQILSRIKKFYKIVRIIFYANKNIPLWIHEWTYIENFFKVYF